MNFEDTLEEAEFRATTRRWIDAHAPRHLELALRQSRYGEAALASKDSLVAARAWQTTKAAAGYACPHWPREYGGGDLTPIQCLIWAQEEGPYAQLSAIFGIGHGMCGPTLMAWGSDSQKQRLSKMVTGEELWCQLFSEPSGGSDLAGLRTRAERATDGSGDWIFNGQKVWTSVAQWSDFGLLLARTDPAVPKHKGLTMFFLNMHSLGLEIRPIRQMNGLSDFNEVYFADVRIPDAQRVGPVNQGWQVSLTTLMNERMSIGAFSSTGFSDILDFACNVQTPQGRPIDDRAVRSKLASWAVRESGLKYTVMRAISSLSRGDTPGPENSVGKLVVGATQQEIAMFAMDLQAQGGILTDPKVAAKNAFFQAMLLRSPAVRIEGGSDEILRNVIAERVLGLPPDVRVDKAVPFNQIPIASRSS